MLEGSVVWSAAGDPGRCLTGGLELLRLQQLAFDPVDMLDPAGVGAVGDDGRPSPPKRLSPSGAATFEQCPRRWRFRYVERLPDPPGIDALIGTFAHRVLELLMQQPPKRRSVDGARRIATGAWPEMSGDDDYPRPRPRR